MSNEMPTSAPTRSKYRPDIDGIRALAIIPVVFYHLRAPFFKGGFVGVDVFFVISGYLIIQIIAAEAQAGNYSLKQFYVRRARRIFPVLFAVVLFLLLVMPFIAFPTEMKPFATSAVYALSFVSNFNFYSLDSYFDEKLLTSPLLHTWSLSVEEQFYVLFPLIMFLMRKSFVKFMKPVILGVGLASFAWCLWATEHGPGAAFYLLPSRAWELMIGGVLAVELVPRVRNRLVLEVLAGLGLVLVAFGLEFTKRSDFPGVQALWPCLGTAMLIYAGQQLGGPLPLVSRLLALSPLRFIGLISYSLYMWHWPLIVIARYTYWPNGVYKVALLALMVGLSALSWKYIELPLRSRKIFSQPKITFSLSGLAAAFLVVLIPASLAFNANLWKVDEATEKLLAYRDFNDEKYARTSECFLGPGFEGSGLPDQQKCLAADGSKKSILLIGDSHAAHLRYGLDTVLTDIKVLQGTATGCQPFIDPKGEPVCVRVMQYLFDDYLKKNHPDSVVLSARWEPGSIPDLVRTIKFLSTRTERVYVVGPMVEYNMALPRILALKNVGRGELFNLQPRAAIFDLDESMRRAVSQETNATYISMVDILCVERGKCLTHASGGAPMGFDTDHLTPEGSVFFAKAFADVASRIAP